MIRLRLYLCIAICFSALSFVHADDEVLNEMCPVMTDEPVDHEIWVEYDGKRVYLCCQKCRRDFSKQPEIYLANLPQFQKPPEELTREDVTPDVEQDIDHEEVQPLGFVERLLRLIGKFHILVIHLPIGLVLAAGLAELLRLWRDNELLRGGALFCVTAGALSAVVSAGLGWIDAAFTNHPGLELTLEWHRWLGSVTAIVACAAAGFALQAARPAGRRWRRPYVALLAAAFVLIFITSHLGGTLIYGSDYFYF